VKVGDLVRYRYQKQDIGIIIETMLTGTAIGDPSLKYKVMWTDTHTDWMRASGLEVVSESR